MAGLPEYIGMGAAVAAIYIGVKYGGQIVHNLQGQQPAVAQTPSDQTSTAPTSQTPASQGDNLDNQNDTGTYPISSQHRAAQHPAAQIPTPSGHDNQTAPIVHKSPRRHTRAARNCICTSEGVWKAYPGKQCGVAGQKCSTGYSDYDYDFEANLGYFNGYEIPTMGPQWRQTIPYRELVASQGMVQRGRVKRALAAGNHEFIPAGFVLSESSVRRGYNNVYSAGT